MTQKILVFAGVKQSGKSSAGNFVAGYVLTQIARDTRMPGLPREFTIDDDGNLLVNAEWTNESGEKEEGMGILDLNRRDSAFSDYANRNIYPFIKLYAFADPLKEIAMRIFNLKENQVYGTNEEKDSKTDVDWKNMCAFLPPRTVRKIKDAGLYTEKMTGRQFLQYFGTNVCRRLRDECWADTCLNNIVYDNSMLAVVTDCRFPNEVMLAKKFGAKIIKLQRHPELGDSHESEKALDKMDNKHFNLVIDNTDMTIKEKNQVILEALYNWGWFNAYTESENTVEAVI